jgi:hypothetical protein
MNMTKKATGRPHTISRTGKGVLSPAKRKTVEQKTVGELKHRVTTEKVLGTKQTEVIVKVPFDVMNAEPDPGRTRSNPIVYEAMELLKTYGYYPARVIEPSLPINIIGMKQSGSLLILALRSRLPVPNAATLRELYTGKVDYLRGMAGKVKDRIMIWVYSPACGWRYYLVYPGGLRYDLDFPESIQ